MLLKRENLRQSFTEESKVAPCIECFSSSVLWRTIENNNRGTERFIGKLRGIVNSLIRDDEDDLARTDLRIRATLHSICE